MWNKSRSTSRRLARLLAGTIVGAGVLGGGAAHAQTPDAGETCVTQTIESNFYVGGPSRSAVFPIAIPAGTVSIPEAIGRDAYAGRASVVGQISEKWQLEFLDAAGAVVAVSAPTEDVPDGEDDQSWSGPLPDVTLDRAVAGIRALHRPDLPATGAPMSVWASGITLCWSVAPSPPVCPPDATGAPVTPNADGTCPVPAPPPAGPILPVTGLESTALIALVGLFVTAAGFSLVLRPRPLSEFDSSTD